MGIFYIFFSLTHIFGCFLEEKKNAPMQLVCETPAFTGQDISEERMQARHPYLHFFLFPALLPKSRLFFPSFSAFSPHFPTMETLMLLGQKPAAFFFPSHPCKAPFSHVFGFLPARHPHPSANTCIGATFPIFFCRLGTAKLFIRGCIRRGDYFL